MVNWTFRMHCTNRNSDEYLNDVVFHTKWHQEVFQTNKKFQLYLTHIKAHTYVFNRTELSLPNYFGFLFYVYEYITASIFSKSQLFRKSFVLEFIIFSRRENFRTTEMYCVNKITLRESCL